MYRNLRESIHDRYLLIFALILLMLSVHVFALPIHPLVFIVWPLSFWLLSEIYIRSGWKRGLLFLFLLTSQVVMTQLFVKVSPDGIFFNLASTKNVPVLSYLPITVAGVLFLYDVLRSPSTSFQDITVYIGFSSTIPWLSPAIVEACILVRWYLQGELWAMTAGKGLGGAGLNDILFCYGCARAYPSKQPKSTQMVASHRRACCGYTISFSSQDHRTGPSLITRRQSSSVCPCIKL